MRTRILCLLLALLAASLAVRPATAADLRFGYIDSARIFQEYSVAKEAQATLSEPSRMEATSSAS